MKFLFCLILLVAPFISSQILAQGRLSVTDLKVPGEITDYHLADLNNDRKLDVVLTFSAANPSGYSRFIAIFLQTQGGFLAEPNQILNIDNTVIGFDFANLSDNEEPELVLISAAAIEVATLKNGLILKESLKLLTAIDFLIQVPDRKHLFHLPVRISTSGNFYDRLLILEPGLVVLHSLSDKKGKGTEKVYLAIENNTHSYKYGSDKPVVLFSCYPDIQLVGNSFPDQYFLIFQNQVSLINLSDFGRRAAKGPLLSISFEEKNGEKTTIEKVADVNQDGIPDLVTRRTKPIDLFSNQVSADFYFGQRVKETMSFPNRPSEQVKAEGLVVDFELADLNNDKRLDVITLEMTVSMGNFISNLVSSDTKGTYKFYLQNNSRFSNVPVLEKGISQKVDIQKDFRFPVFLSAGADFDGDNFPELLVKRSDRNLSVYAGSGPSVVSAQPVLESNIQVPLLFQKPEGVNIFDDKREDLILLYGSDDPDGLRSVLRIISR